ncbi:MAG: methylmalonyl-CoA mutase family protein [Chloroflexota bacterium]
MDAEARKYIERIDSLGGVVAAIEQGFEQREIQEASYRYQQEIEKGERVVVGVNKFVSPFPRIAGILRVSLQEQQRQLARLAEVKGKRDQTKVQACLKRLEVVARALMDAGMEVIALFPLPLVRYYLGYFRSISP